MENYKERYKEALERAQKMQENSNGMILKKWLWGVFPELKEKENDDERIRKEIIDFVKSRGGFKGDWITWLEKQAEKKKFSIWKHWKNGIAGHVDGKQIYLIKMGNTYSLSSCLGFECDYIELSELDNLMLEKQDEKKPIFNADHWYVSKVDGKIHNMTYNPTDEVEPKFKPGDWIIFNGLILHIDEVVNGYYRTTSKGDGIHNSYDWNIDNAARLWTIQEAKDGNVLAYVTDEEDLWIMIYRSLYEPYEGHVHYHALLVNDNFSDKGTCCICIDNLKPATKEQRELLFQKMKEAGYKWDSEKKELKKMEVVSKESEDERIRKAIIRILKGETRYTSKEDADKYVTWLEKQGLEKQGELLNESVYDTKDKEIYQAISIGLTDVFNEFGWSDFGGIPIEDIQNWLEKQGEQEPILPKWKYKKDHIPLLKDSLILNKYGCVGKSPSGAIVSDVWVLDYDELAKLPKEELEKQEEKKPTDEVNPKFKVRDWILNDVCFPLQIASIRDGMYVFTEGDAISVSFVDEHLHLWTIQDAMDGDVLINWNNTTFIFKAIEDETVKFHIAYNEKWDTIKTPSTKLSHLGLPEPQFEFHPATKGQHDLLFQKMKEAGYEWNNDKKELKKI